MPGLVINAPNVHSGGGVTLLTALLESLDRDFRGCLVLDERMTIPKALPRGVVIHRIQPTILSRIWGQWRLRKWAETNDVVLCFGNLPPLFKLRNTVIVFVQNRYLVERRRLKGFAVVQQLRILAERFWFLWAKRNATHFVVQSDSMHRILERVSGKQSIVLPFFNFPVTFKLENTSNHRFDQEKRGFLYIASGEPHKNHRHLIEAWELLASEGIHPMLSLTLDQSRFYSLCAWIENRKQERNLHITNLGDLSKEDLLHLYGETQALIYPSDFESFGLPLVEARHAGLDILASEKDFVRDVVEPNETFDPCSAVSIARAVKRYLGIPEQPPSILTAKQFLTRILQIAQT